jgi:hypothetical protein
LGYARSADVAAWLHGGYKFGNDATVHGRARRCIPERLSSLRLLSQSQQLVGISTQLAGDFHEFGDIKPPLSALVFGDEGLGSTQPRSQLDLGDAGFLAGPDKLLQGAFIKFGEKRAQGASASLELAPQRNRKSDYPNFGLFYPDFGYLPVASSRIDGGRL